MMFSASRARALRWFRHLVHEQAAHQLQWERGHDAWRPTREYAKGTRRQRRITGSTFDQLLSNIVERRLPSNRQMQAGGENVQREGRYHRALHGATRLAITGGRGQTRALIPTASCTIFKHQYIAAAAAAAPSLLDDKRTNTSRLGCLTVTI